MHDQSRLPRLLRAGTACYAAVLVLAVWPYSPLPAVDIKIPIIHLAAFALIAVCAVAEWRGVLPAARPRVFPGIVVAFVAVNALASATSPYPANACVMTARFFSMAVTYYVTARAFTDVRQASHLFLAIAGATGVASVYGFCQRAGIDPLPWDTSFAAKQQYEHLPSTFGNPNLAGHVLTLAVLCAVYLSFQRGRRWALLLAPLFVAHLALTQHRASALGLGTAFVFAVIAWRVRSRGGDPRAGVRRTIAAFALASIAIGALGVGALLTRNGRGAPMDSSLLLRYNSFYGAARMIVERPLLGVGPDNYRILNTRYWTPYEQEHFARDRMANEHPHNEFLAAAVAAGAPGLLVYALLLMRGFAAGLSAYFGAPDAALRRFGLACAAFFLVFGVDGTMGFNLYAPVSGGLLFLVAGLLDGVLSAGLACAPARPRRPVAAALVPVAGGCAVLAVVVFAGQLYLARGNGAMFWKAYPQAAEEYDRAAVLLPWDWMPSYHAARARAAANDLPGALEDLSASLKRNPHYVPALIDAAFIELRLAAGEPPGAPPAVLDAARAYAREAQTYCAVAPEAEEVLGKAALIEAQRVRVQPGGAAAEVGRLVQEASDRFGRAIGYGAPNARELAGLQIQTGAAQ